MADSQEQATYLLMNSGLPFKHFSAFSTYKVIGLLVDKTFNKGCFSFSAHQIFTASSQRLINTMLL